MADLFLTILNMSLTASYVILCIMLLRLPLKKLPKAISYALWSIAAFRLLCPFSFESMWSLLPINTSPIPKDIVYQQTPQINSGISAVDTYVNSSLPTPAPVASVNPLQIYVEIGAYLWLLGIAVMLIYSIVSIRILKNRLKNARYIEQNIYETDNLKTPFVLGIFRPRIYIFTGLSAEEKSYIIRHEQIHICRRDHIIKPFSFLVLSLHWFNPLVWIAFVLMSTDMELSCDERVLGEMGREIKKAYSTSLLSLASGRHIINGSPLAFGEGNVKGRIKNILNYKKPVFWMVAAAIVIVAALGIGLLANPQNNGLTQKEAQEIIEEEYPSQQTKLEPAAANWSPEQTISVDMAQLDYASDDIVIFHDYFGLFVYDLDALQIIRSLDLEPLNCEEVQGDNYCDVTVSRDGTTVQLHPMSSEKMYVYNVSDNTLIETAFQKMEDQFDSFVPTEELINFKVIAHYSHNSVKFGTGKYGYLYTYDWTLSTLSYSRGDVMYALFGIDENYQDD